MRQETNKTLYLTEDELKNAIHVYLEGNGQHVYPWDMINITLTAKRAGNSDKEQETPFIKVNLKPITKTTPTLY